MTCSLFHVSVSLFREQFGTGFGVEEEFVDFLDVFIGDFLLAVGFRVYFGGYHELYAVAQTGGAADLAQLAEPLVGDVDALGFGSNIDDGHDFLQVLGHGADDQSSVQQVSGDPVWTFDQGAADAADSAVGGHDQDGTQSRLQRIVQLGEGLDVQHVDFVDEEHARHKFGDALLNLAVDHFVDFPAQFVGYFGFLLLVQLVHK
mmetsp:Transcript_85776/g.185208  ORF Transcript_85776/g.185208 Transcript_85776/m.185208 type:complete len:203 (-) Transcript_85776:31-639(-)